MFLTHFRGLAEQGEREQQQRSVERAPNPKRQSSCWCCRARGLIYGVRTPRGKEKPLNSRGAAAVVLGMWLFQGNLGTKASRAPGHGPPEPRSPPGVGCSCGNWVRAGGPAPPEDAVTAMGLFQRHSGAVRAISAEPGPCPVPPSPDGAWGCSYLAVITNWGGGGGGNPNPFSARPRGRRRRFSPCQQFICCLSSLSPWRSQDVFWAGEFGSVGFTSRSLRCPGTYFALGIPCGISHPSPCPCLCILAAPGECDGDSEGGSGTPREWVGRRLRGTDRAGMFSVSSCFLSHESEYFIWLRASSLNLKIAVFLPGGMEQFAFSRFFTQISRSPHTQ